MENLATWRSLYDLRYCPVTLVQTVFSAGTVYLLIAMRASSGVRVAQKELTHALEQHDLVMTYLNEIGRSWQCATNIGGILKGLMQDQLNPRLERRPLLYRDSLQIPNDSDEEKVSIPLRSPRSPRIDIPRKSRRRGSTSRVVGSISTSRGGSVSTSPTIPISPINSRAYNQSAGSSPQIQFPSKPLTVEIPSGPSSFSSRPSSFVDLQNWMSPGSASHNRRRSDASSSPSFVQSTIQCSLPSLSHHTANGTDAPASSEHVGQTNLDQGHSLDQIFNIVGHSPTTSSQLANAFSGFRVIQGGHSIPPAPFVGPFSVGEGELSSTSMAFDPSLFDGSPSTVDQLQYGSFNHYVPSNSIMAMGTNEMDLDPEELALLLMNGAN